MGEETVRFHSLLLGASPRDRDALVLEFARIFQMLELCPLPHMGSGGS